MGDRVDVELLYNSVKTEVKTVEFEFQAVPVRAGDGVIDECGRESHTRPRGPSGTPMEFGDQRSC